MGILGAIGGLVSSAFGDIVSTAGNIYSTSQANAANRDLWREQAAYNTPKNQMLRYQEAGLNPNLVYSQGNPGNMTSSPTMQAAKIDFNPMKSFALSATMKNMVEQNKNLQAQNSLLRTQGSLAKEQVRKMELENNFFEKNGYYPSSELPWTRTVRTLWNYVSGVSDLFEGKYEQRRQSRGLRPRGDVYYRPPVGH